MACGERLSPALPRLVGQAGNQVDVDVVDAGGTKAIDLAKGNGSRVRAPHSRCFVIHKRLHAETDAVEAKSGKGLQQFVAQLARSAFQRNFCRIFDEKYFSYCINYFF